MTRAKLLGRAALAAPLVLVACTETPYPFFQDPPPIGCANPPCPSPSTGGLSPSEGGSPGAGGTGGLGEGGTGSTPVLGENCTSSRDPAVTVERLQLALSGACVTRGAYELLLMKDPSYATALETCAADIDQVWAFSTLPGGGLEVRHEATDMNLDVRFAATDDGTPIGLFAPHQFQNQSFAVIASASGDGTFKLAPLNALTKCLTEQDGTLVLLPCAAGLNEQSFRRLTCH